MIKLIETIFSIINEMSLFLLLGFFLAGILHVFVPQQVYAKYLSKNNFMSVFYAALFGVPLPLCSCGVIPTAMALRKEGASKGSVVAFLIATPQTGIDSIIATYSLLGLPFAIIRPIAAFVTSIFAGIITNCFNKKDTINIQSLQNNNVSTKKNFIEKIKNVFQYSFVEMVEDIGKMLVIGLIIAGLITYFVPDNFFTMFEGNTFITMILILIVAIPMYICATGSIPIAIALMLKGMSPGTALVLLMAGPAANMASILVIGKVLGKKTLILYILTISLGAIGFGLFIDNFLPNAWFDVSNFVTTSHHHSSIYYYIKIVASIILLSLIVYSLFKKETNHVHNNVVAYKVSGMRCNKCKANVIKVLSNLEGTKSVDVNLEQGIVYINTTAKDDDIKNAIFSIGFEVKEKL